MARMTFCSGVRKASMAEPAAARLYRRLIANAPNKSVRQIIRGIRADEIMHRGCFRAIKRRFC